ncbi:MAG: phosphoesterase PA-phosphatase related protein [Ilumatobacteraceae bacterium]|nr:phosphoesterase PA-phosphatase related protein [Ilumatobacteraceae bacterium]
MVAVVYVIAIRTHLGQRLDDVAFARRSVVTAATTRRTDRLLGTISTASLFVFGGAIVLIALARRRLRLAVAVGIAMSGAVLTTEVLKRRILTRPRFGGVYGVAGNSFPSGHAAIGMVLSLGIVMVAPLRLRRPALIVGGLTATAFGTAVLSSGWHRPSDTIGAYFVALAWFAAVSALLVRVEQRSRARPDPAVDPVLSRALLATAAIVVFGLLMFVLWKSVHATGLRTVVNAAPYIAACIAIDVVGLLIVGTFYVVQRTSATSADHHRAPVQR